MKRMLEKKYINANLYEGYSSDVASTKKIYCHPINFSYVIDTDNSFDISMLIFNNDSTPFTFDTFKSWLEDLAEEITTVRIVSTGMIVISNTRYPANYFLYRAANKLMIVRPSTDGVTDISLDLSSIWDSITPRYFVDGVNPIN